MIKVTTNYDEFIVDITAIIDDDDEIELSSIKVNGLIIDQEFINHIAPEFIEFCEEAVEQNKGVNTIFDDTFYDDYD